MNDLKFCKDCKHYTAPEIVPGVSVTAESCDGGPPAFDMINGAQIMRSPREMREMPASEAFCGPDATWFEAKESQQ